jgi:FtsZ-binding cell division protein ZapB
VDKDQLITKQQLELEELKQKVTALEECMRDARGELDNVEQWINPKSAHLPKLAINAINKARWLTGRII